MSTPSRVNIVRFACGESRLLVAQDNGSILVYDTSDLFSGDSKEVRPLTSAHIQSTYLHQIVPNPGTETGLSDLVAVVSDGKVQLLNIALEPQGGWVASDLMSQPISGKLALYIFIVVFPDFCCSLMVAEGQTFSYRSSDWRYFDIFSNE